MNAPAPDPLVEKLFVAVMEPPEGYNYFISGNQLLFPVYGQDRWRLLLSKNGTDELVPMFLEGQFILKLTKALHAMQRELNQAVSDDIGEPVKRASD